VRAVFAACGGVARSSLRSSLCLTLVRLNLVDYVALGARPAEDVPAVGEYEGRVFRDLVLRVGGAT